MNADNNLVGSVYETALDPEQLDELVKHWTERVGPTLSTSKYQGPALEQHLTNAFVISERLAQTPTPNTAQPELTFERSGIISNCNDAALAAYNLSKGSKIMDLPFYQPVLDKLERYVLNTTSAQEEKLVFTAQIVTAQRTVLCLLERTNAQVVLTTSDFTWPPHLKGLLQEGFELTDAETEVAKYVAEAVPNAKIAELRQTSVETVRAQVKSIYAKTAVHSAVELTRLVLGLTTLLPEDLLNPAQQSTTEFSPYPRPDQRRTLSLPQDRILDFSIFGAEKGYPVLFIHDEKCGDAWTAEAVRAASRRGLKIIAPLRPCYGRSSPVPADTEERRMQVAQDMLLLLEHLGCNKVTVLARGMGAGVAMCLSSIAPASLHGIVSVAPALPVRDEDFANMNPMVRIMIHSLFHNQTLARFLMHTHLAVTERSGIKQRFQTLYKDTGNDAQVVADAQTQAALEQGASTCRAQGYQGFLGDVFDAAAPYERCARLINNRTHILIGEQDANGRSQRAAHLADMSNDVEVKTLPDVGELFFYSHYEKIFNSIDELRGVE